MGLPLDHANFGIRTLEHPEKSARVFGKDHPP
jgi:hypothetical protein